MVRIPRANDPRNTDFPIAADDAARLVQSAGAVLEDAIDVEWYEQHGTEVDRAALTLCRIRRAVAGQRGRPEHGDEAVRVRPRQREPRSRSLDREPRDLVHGRERLSRCRRARGSRRRSRRSALSGRGARGAARPVGARQRRSTGARAIRPPCSPRTIVGPVPSAARAVWMTAPTGAPRTRCRTRSRPGRPRPLSRTSWGWYCGSGAPSVKTRSSRLQTWTNTTCVSGGRAEEPCEPRSRDRLRLAVREDHEQSACVPSVRSSAGSGCRERLEVGRVLCERRARRRLLDAERAIDGRVEDLAIGAREEVRERPVRDRGDSEPDLGE